MGKCNSTLSLRCASEALTMLRGQNSGDLTADCVASAVAFTARIVEGNAIESRRVGILLVADEATAEGRELYSPEMVDALLEQFFLMIASAAGPETMMHVMHHRHHLAIEQLVDQAEQDIGLGCENLN